jgi:hypothetical protein
VRSLLREAVPLAALACGAGLAVYGVWLLSSAAALIAGGVTVAVAACRLALAQQGEERGP